MNGFITKNEVENQKYLIIELYGLRFYLACLNCEGTTFLAMLVKFGKI